MGHGPHTCRHRRCTVCLTSSGLWSYDGARRIEKVMTSLLCGGCWFSKDPFLLRLLPFLIQVLRIIYPSKRFIHLLKVLSLVSREYLTQRLLLTHADVFLPSCRHLFSPSFGFKINSHGHRVVKLLKALSLESS
jgi:hypothetical protein